MREILAQAGADLRITANRDGTYTATIGMQRQIFADFPSAIEWACEMRDKEKRYEKN